MKQFSLIVATTLMLSSCQTAMAPMEAQRVTAFTGAKLFDGATFEPKTLCTLDRVIVACPDNPGQTVDLSGQFVTTPFGDAHTHHFDGTFTLGWHKSLGLESGTFYAMTMTAPTRGVTAIRDQLMGPGNIDVATSLGGITGPDSHPAEIYEALALGIRTFEDQVARADDIQSSRKAADDAYYVVETKADVRAKLALLLENDPDHVKVYLRKSDLYAEGYGKWGPGGGIDAALLPMIVELAKDAGKRVAVAASSIADYRAALNAGADIVTHLPCYQDSASDPDSPYYDVDVEEGCLISAAEAEQAAAEKVVSTLITTEWSKDRPEELVTWEGRNIAALQKAKATLVVATNAYGSTLTPGLIAGVEKGFFTPADMLTMATMTTPQVIFPARRVGCLDVGCDASFIAFLENPLDRFDVIGDITYRYKDGEPIILSAEDG